MWADYQIPNTVAAAIAAGTPRILAFREGGGVTPNALAQAANISAERILQLEEGMIPTETELLDISNALAVPIAILAGT